MLCAAQVGSRALQAAVGLAVGPAGVGLLGCKQAVLSAGYEGHQVGAGCDLCLGVRSWYELVGRQLNCAPQGSGTALGCAFEGLAFCRAVQVVNRLTESRLPCHKQADRWCVCPSSWHYSESKEQGCQHEKHDRGVCLPADAHLKNTGLMSRGCLVPGSHFIFSCGPKMQLNVEGAPPLLLPRCRHHSGLPCNCLCPRVGAQACLCVMQL